MTFWCTGILALSLVAGLQIADTGAQTMPVMGYVAAKNANPKRLEVFKQGLTGQGYIEGKNIRIEYREAVLDTEYHVVMTELINHKVDIILAANDSQFGLTAKSEQPLLINESKLGGDCSSHAVAN